MSYDNTQPKPGHLSAPSVNKTKRTGRPDGQGGGGLSGEGRKVQVADGYPHTESPNPTDRGERRSLEPKGQLARGYVHKG